MLITLLDRFAVVPEFTEVTPEEQAAG